MSTPSPLPRDLVEECDLYRHEFDTVGTAEAERRREARIKAAGCKTFSQYIEYLKLTDPVYL